MLKYEIHNPPHLKVNRQKLRKNPTSAEAILWQHLRKEQLHGRKIRRQHSIENFIVDFYCASEKLIIELDGVHHFEDETFENDKVRDARLQQLNYKVLRFPNEAVCIYPEAVLKTIAENFSNNQISWITF